MTGILQSLWAHMPSGPEFVSALPTIYSLILIEGLLSVDNAMAIASMASALPVYQQKLALRYGIIGAYAFRFLCLFFVGWIISNQWIKAFGAMYLIYLACSHLTQEEEEEQNHTAVKAGKGLFATIMAIEIMDLSLSLDNVVAAVALDKRLWVVCTGVFIGILALRFVAGYCIKLIEKFPVLKKTAFLLVGFVGCILIVELSLEHQHIHFHINSFQKFIGIVLITGACIWYDHTPLGRKVLEPVVMVGMPVLRMVNAVLGMCMLPFILLFKGAKKLFAPRKSLVSQA